MSRANRTEVYLGELREAMLIGLTKHFFKEDRRSFARASDGVEMTPAREHNSDATENMRCRTVAWSFWDR